LECLLPFTSHNQDDVYCPGQHSTTFRVLDSQTPQLRNIPGVTAFVTGILRRSWPRWGEQDSVRTVGESVRSDSTNDVVIGIVIIRCSMRRIVLLAAILSHVQRTN
jgi:hypothetical protein